MIRTPFGVRIQDFSYPHMFTLDTQQVLSVSWRLEPSLNSL
jgi:hypothetical protein